MSWEQLDLELSEMFHDYTWRPDETAAALELFVAQRIVTRREYFREHMRRQRSKRRIKLGLPPAKKYAYGLTKEEKLARRREKQNARWARRRIAAGFPPPKKYRSGVTIEMRREENRIKQARLREQRRMKEAA